MSTLGIVSHLSKWMTNVSPGSKVTMDSQHLAILLMRWCPPCLSMSQRLCSWSCEETELSMMLTLEHSGCTPGTAGGSDCTLPQLRWQIITIRPKPSCTCTWGGQSWTPPVCRYHQVSLHTSHGVRSRGVQQPILACQSQQWQSTDTTADGLRREPLSIGHGLSRWSSPSHYPALLQPSFPSLESVGNFHYSSPASE